MKKFCCIVAAAVLMSAPLMTRQAMAQQAYGGGTDNIWSSAQGTSYTYGHANAAGLSMSGAIAAAGGLGALGAAGIGGGGLTSAFTISNAATSAYNGGYAQEQTSGYAGGTVSGYGGRGR